MRHNKIHGYNGEYIPIKLCSHIKSYSFVGYWQWPSGDSKKYPISSRENCKGIIAVGNRQFVEDTKIKLGLKAHRRQVIDSNDKFVLKDDIA